MRNSILILVLAAFTLIIAGLAVNALAECTTCTTEGDWGQSADNFIAGKPTSEDAPAWGPKAVRQKNSQTESNSTDETAPATASESTSPKWSLELVNASAMPAVVGSGSPIKITAAFKESNSANTGSAGSEVRVTALATILDSAGKEVGNASLLQTSPHEYSGVWDASVAPGVYKVSIAAASLRATGVFENALDIRVVESDEAGSGNAAPSVPAVKNLG